MSDDKTITVTIHTGGNVEGMVSFDKVIDRAGVIAALRTVLGALESAGGAGLDVLPRFAAREWLQVNGRGPMALTSLDRDTKDFAHLTGRDVIIDGMVYRCKGIEWFGHNRERGRVGDSISIEVEGASRAPASPPGSSPPVAGGGGQTFVAGPGFGGSGVVIRGGEGGGMAVGPGGGVPGEAAVTGGNGGRGFVSDHGSLRIPIPGVGGKPERPSPPCTCVLRDHVPADRLFSACEAFVDHDSQDNRWVCRRCGHEKPCHSWVGSAVAEHPAPWRWDYKPTAHIPWCLVDANNMSMGVVSTRPDADAIPPAVRELIRMAPELERALRNAVASMKNYELDEGGAHAEPAARIEAEAILAALDAARETKRRGDADPGPIAMDDALKRILALANSGSTLPGNLAKERHQIVDIAIAALNAARAVKP